LSNVESGGLYSKGVPDGDPFAIILFAIFLAVTFAWLATPGISPLGGNAASAKVEGQFAFATNAKFLGLFKLLIPIAFFVFAKFMYDKMAGGEAGEKVQVFLAPEKIIDRSGELKRQLQVIKARKEHLTQKEKQDYIKRGTTTTEDEEEEEE